MPSDVTRCSSTCLTASAALELPAALTSPPHSPAVQVCLPLSLQGCKTTVWELGSLGGGGGGARTAPAQNSCGGPPAASRAADASAGTSADNPAGPSAAASDADGGELYWHVVGRHKAFPLPPGYRYSASRCQLSLPPFSACASPRGSAALLLPSTHLLPSALPPCRASCTCYGRQCTLTVQAAADGSGGSTHHRRPRFVLTTADGGSFEGSTPTAPLTKLALSLGQPAMLNGMEVRATGMLIGPFHNCIKSKCGRGAGRGRPAGRRVGGWLGEAWGERCSTGGSLGSHLCANPFPPTAPHPPASLSGPTLLLRPLASCPVQLTLQRPPPPHSPLALTSAGLWLSLHPGAAGAPERCRRCQPAPR